MHTTLYEIIINVNFVSVNIKLLIRKPLEATWAYETFTIMSLDGWLTTITNVVFGCGDNQSLGVLWGGWNCWFRAKHFLFSKPVPRNLC